MRMHRHLIAALALSSISWAAQADSPAQWQTLTRDVQISLEQAIQNATKTVCPARRWKWNSTTAREQACAMKCRC